MSKILANQIANYGDDAPIEIKEGLNIPAGKPIQAAGNAGSSGQVLSTTGVDLAWITPFDGDYSSLSNKPTIPAAQVNADWNASSGLGVILNKPTVPLQTSLVVNPAGTPALSYNGANGQLTYTPPDLTNYDTAYGWGNHASAGYLTSLGDAAGVTTAKITNWDTAHGWGDHGVAGYLTSFTETDPVYAASAAAGVTTTKIGNWDTAFGWGNHASAGYLTSAFLGSSSLEDLGDVSLPAPNAGQFLKWDGTNWIAAGGVGGGVGIALSDLSVTTAAAGTAALSYSNISGIFTYTPPDLSGYLTSETDPVFTASAAAGIQSSNISNWDAAHGWGNHALAGYLTSVPAQSFASLTGKPTTISGYGITDSYSNSDVDAHLNQSNPTSGHVLSWNGSDYAWVAQSGGGGGASVTISDTAPAASAGDLWWESDTGRLKIYYTDTNSSQWVDTSPPLADATTLGGSGTVSMLAHLIPDTNAAYDFGSAEYKIRHLFLSDNTLYHEGAFLKVAQHDAGGSAQAASYLITLAKLKQAVNASADYDAFKAAILAITDA